MAVVACAECCAVYVDTTTGCAYAVFVGGTKECMLWMKLQRSISTCDVRESMREDAKTKQSITN